jgi:exosome complex component RRP42
MAGLLSKAEKAYIRTSLESSPPLRADGRGLYDYRSVALETGVVPLANGSARIRVNQTSDPPSGGTEIIAAAKLEVEDVENGDGIDGGRIVCVVTWYVSYFSPDLCLRIYRVYY